MRMNFKNIYLKSMLIGFLCFTLSAFADNPAGKVITVDGTVVAVSATGVSRVLKRGDDLFAKEIVKTDEKSTVVLRYIDGTIVQLQKASSYVVHSFNYAKNEPEKDSFSAELLMGGFRSITGKIGSRSPQSFETRARETTLTVRGTQFEGNLPACPEGSVSGGEPCLDCLWHVTVGSIEVNFQGKITAMNAGTNTAGYSLQNGVITLMRTAPPGTGAAAYHNEPLQMYVSSQANTVNTSSETTTTTGTSSGGVGGGGSDPCSQLQTIQGAIK